MRHKRTWFLLLTGMLFGATLVIAARYIIDLVESPVQCKDRTVKEVPSPNGRRIAALVVTNCGATTPFVSVVQVKNLDGPQEGVDYFFAVKGIVDMDMIWDDNYNFTIVYDRTEKIYRQVLVWNSAQIKYRERP
jgi:hypothetical protein